MHQYCGDTQVLVFSDGPTGLGGDPDEAMAEVARLAARGVNVSTVAPALGEQRVAQLEHLAWVGYGQHYYTDTLSDALSAFQRTLERPGWIARDVSVQVAFDSDAVTEVRTVSGDGLAWFFEGLERGRSHGALYEVTLAEGTDTDRFMDVSWTAGSPVPGEWKRSGHRAIERAELSTRFEEAPAGVRLSWIAASFAMHLEGREINPGLETLLEMARDARREAVRSDVELIALIDRAIRAE